MCWIQSQPRPGHVDAHRPDDGTCCLSPILQPYKFGELHNHQVSSRRNLKATLPYVVAIGLPPDNILISRSIITELTSGNDRRTARPASPG